MTSVDRNPTRDLIVVGAGFAGLYAIHAAAVAGLDVLCLEAADGIGGTWYFNRYPGCRCDVESVDYSYSFDEDLQNEWEWSERYATQPEILAYIHYAADRFGLHNYIRLNTPVRWAGFDEHASLWQLATQDGAQYCARHVIFATGSLSTPIKPDIAGVDDFAGEVYFTARWPEQDPSFEGKRVGVIGTGSSGIQSIPVVAEQAASLTVFQRTANYSVPAYNRELTDSDQQRIRAEYPERRRKSRQSGGGSPHQAQNERAVDVTVEQRATAFEAAWQTGGVLFSKTFPDQFTSMQANDYAREFFEKKVRAKVTNPDTVEDLIPNDHPIGTKRICTDSGYYETFNRNNVELVNLRKDPISAITEWGIKTASAAYELDMLIYATGFDAMTGTLLAIDIEGARGTRIQDTWADGPVTYLGMHVPGYPNMFVINGPGSPSVLANMVLTSEQQVDWLIELITTCRESGVSQVEARDDAARKWTEHITDLADGTLFPRANSWYMGANIDGKKRGFMLYAGGLESFTKVCEEVRTNDYEGLVLTKR